MKIALKRYLNATDFFYLFLCGMLSCISIVTLFSVGRFGGLNLSGIFGNLRPAYTQILAAALGIPCALAVSAADHRVIEKVWPLFAVLCWAAVLLTFVPGIGYEPPGTGSRSWIPLPFGMSFQPTEIAKVAFILSFSVHLHKVRSTLNHPGSIFPVLLHLGLPVLLVHLQGDDGTAVVFLAIGGIMLVAAGLNRWVVAIGSAVAAGAAWPVWNYLLSQYQRDRILGLFNPVPYADTIMYQQLRARQAIGLGGFAGSGLSSPNHTYVPRPENDFIFSYFAESCGFIGCLLLLGLLLALLYKTLHAALHSAHRAGAYVCIGVFAMLFFQCIVNIGMNLMLVPVMGITLPFVSAGGTSSLVLYLAVGLVLAVKRQSKWKQLAV